MKTLICCLSLTLTSAFAAERIEHANFQVESIEVPDARTGQGILQGIAAVGHVVPGVPCGACLGAPNGTFVIPFLLQIYAPGKAVDYYYSIQTANVSGTADVTINVSQGSTTLQTITGQVGLNANSVSVIAFPSTIPNVSGAATVTFTTTLNGVTVHGRSLMWILPSAPSAAAGIGPGMMQGIAAVGHVISGVPCGACFGAPSDTFVVPSPDPDLFTGASG